MVGSLHRGTTYDFEWWRKINRDRQSWILKRFSYCIEIEQTYLETVKTWVALKQKNPECIGMIFGKLIGKNFLVIFTMLLSFVLSVKSLWIILNEYFLTAHRSHNWILSAWLLCDIWTEPQPTTCCLSSTRCWSWLFSFCQSAITAVNPFVGFDKWVIVWSESRTTLLLSFWVDKFKKFVTFNLNTLPLHFLKMFLKEASYAKTAFIL